MMKAKKHIWAFVQPGGVRPWPFDEYQVYATLGAVRADVRRFGDPSIQRNPKKFVFNRKTKTLTCGGRLEAVLKRMCAVDDSMAVLFATTYSNGYVLRFANKTREGDDEDWKTIQGYAFA